MASLVLTPATEGGAKKRGAALTTGNLATSMLLVFLVAYPLSLGPLVWYFGELRIPASSGYYGKIETYSPRYVLWSEAGFFYPYSVVEHVYWPLMYIGDKVPFVTTMLNYYLQCWNKSVKIRRESPLRLGYRGRTKPVIELPHLLPPRTTK